MKKIVAAVLVLILVLMLAACEIPFLNVPESGSSKPETEQPESVSESMPEESVPESIPKESVPELTEEELYEVWASLSGYWNNDAEYRFIALDMKDSHSAVLDEGIWQAGGGRGFGDVSKLNSAGEGILEATLYYPAKEETEMTFALPELTQKISVDYSKREQDGKITIKIGEKEALEYYYAGASFEEAYENFESDTK